MGMVIYNNLPAMSILNENNKNLKKATKAMGQLSLGEKIRNAGDDAATYAITEKMKGKIRAIDQCHANSDKGKSMLDLASAAVDEQVNIMKQVKVCALRATDGTYTDIDRATIQKEVAQMLDQSDTIAHQTTFNGIHLLNQRTLSRRDYWFDSDAPYKPNVDNTPVLTQAVGGEYRETMGTYYPLYNGVGYDQNSLHGGSDRTTLPSVGEWVWDSASNSAKQVTKDSTGTLLIGGTRVTVNGKSNPPGNPPDSSTNVKEPILDARTTPPNVGSQVAISNKPSFDSSGNVLTETVTETPGSHVLSYFKPVADQIHGSGPSVMELDFTALQGAVSNVGDLDGKGFSMDCGACDQFITVMFDSNSSVT
ncbi:flagellin, partial [Anaerovibrio lipolyticus]|uniref:flagellin n=1 Tax=Anaerovibrio lipolyticus TaxID=82374 RepID=UPI0023F1C715